MCHFFHNVNANIANLDVPLPSNFGLHYEDLELKTSDDVVLRCFLLPQKKDLGPGSAHIEISRGITEEAVSSSIFVHLSYTLSHILLNIVYCQSTNRDHVSW